MTKSLPTVHVILPVHNRVTVTRRFLECLNSQKAIPWRLVLIDDGSTDGTEELVRSSCPDAVVIRGDGNLWWAGALQQGYLFLRDELAKGLLAREELALLINDDTEFDEDFFSTAIDLLATSKRTLLLAGAYDKDTGKFVDAGVVADFMRFRFRPPRPGQAANCLSTRGLFLRLGDFMEIGGFYPRLLPHYGSDYEFTLRAGRKGFKLLTTPRLRLRADLSTTGYQSSVAERQTKRELSPSSFISRFFSKKTEANPVYWSSFILLAAPWPWKLSALCLAWARAAVIITRGLLRL